jgi:hypothetical protein
VWSLSSRPPFLQIAAPLSRLHQSWISPWRDGRVVERANCLPWLVSVVLGRLFSLNQAAPYHEPQPLSRGQPLRITWSSNFFVSSSRLLFDTDISFCYESASSEFSPGTRHLSLHVVLRLRRRIASIAS